MKQDILNIVNTKELSVKEKYDKIGQIQNDFNQFCIDTRKDLTKGYIFCPYCKTFYKEKAWDIEEFIKEEERCDYGLSTEIDCLCSTALAYRTVQVPYIRKICPVGHTIEEEQNESNNLV